MDEALGLVLAQPLGFLLEKKRRELHRLDAHTPLHPHLGGDLLEPLERSRRERDQTPLGPTGPSRSL
jgi:hypothetical protein